MTITVLKSKIHNATVTECVLYYEGSISIDSELIRAAGLYEYEKVLVVNINNSERFETYIINAPAGSREIGLNGAAARLAVKGDKIIIMAFADIPETEVETHKPKIVIVNDNNTIARIKS